MIGAVVKVTALFVTSSTREAVLTLLFASSTFARCDAAMKLAENRRYRWRILGKIYHRSYVQLLKRLACVDLETRVRMEAVNPNMGVRELARLLFEPTPTSR
ncbi:MAG: hypothetical protein IPK82_24100 [Polyangiaceae bacterium]|nr:hypothetical protein [Polyangiaceae bacterium]